MRRKQIQTLFPIGILIFSSILMSVASLTSAAPPPPTPAVHATPTEPPTASAGRLSYNPPMPGDLPLGVDEARARQAIEAVLEKHLRYWGPRYRVTPVEVTVEGEWAHGVAQWQSQIRALDGPIHILAHRLPDGAWQALMPSSDGLYLRWVDAVPESLVPVGEKVRLRIQAAEADAMQRPQAMSPAPQVVPAMPYSKERPSGSGGPILMPTLTPSPQPKTWISGETSVSQLSAQERARLCGVPLAVIEWENVQASREVVRPKTLYTYPSAHDWRNVNGQDWTTPVRNQAGCGSCVAFGTIASIESRIEIANNNPNLNPDLSEAHLFYCGCGECCETGWYPGAAMDFVRDTGIVDEGCYPYTDQDQPCSPCPDWQSRVTKISGWNGTSNIDEMKQVLADYGPFEATMAVYEDFFYYSGGIYHHIWGNLTGYHAVTIVGYDDAGGYWIAKNSWGTGWGEDKYGNPNGGGWFRIAYGECEIDNYVYIPSINSPPSCIPNADQVALFVDANYNGQCVVKDIGEYPNSGSIGLPNDSISSVKVGENVRAVLCRDDNYGGGCETFYSNDPDLSDNSIGNDQVSSIKVEQQSSPCNPNADQVAIYADTGYSGACVTLDIGDYPNPSYLGSLGNDNAESVRVGSNVQAILCEHDAYQGRCETFAGDDPDLGDNYIGANVVSSVRVQSLAVIGPLVYDGHTVDDDNNDQSRGDGDGIVECGETIELYVALYNQGNAAATGVTVTISTNDPYVTWLYNTDSAYPDIPNEGTGINSNDFDFAVDPSTPNGHTIQFDLNIIASNGGPWSDTFAVPVACASCSDPHEPNDTPGQAITIAYGAIVSDPDICQAGDIDYYAFSGSAGDTIVADIDAQSIGSSLDSYLYLYNTDGVTELTHNDDYDGLDSHIEYTLPADGVYYLMVREYSHPNEGGSDYFYTLSLARSFIAPYADDMESNVNDWASTGLWHRVDASTPYPASHSWSHSWWYGQDDTGNYDTGSANSGDLTSPPIHIPDTGYYLRFWYRYETETQTSYWDQRWVQISVDDGPFENVLQLSDDPMNWWLQSPVIDLSGYAGHVIRVRFHFNTIDALFNNYRGWYIDDFSISTTPPPSCADSHEPNDIPAEATAIAYGQTLSADICPGGDYDYYTFTGTAGDRVVVDIDAEVSGSLLDSYIFLLDSDGTNVLAEHDDEILAEVHDSRLSYQLSHDGVYYIKVKAWSHPSAGGTDYFYTIHLLTDDVSPTAAEITSPGNGAWLDPHLATVTVSASDGESGINRVEFLWHNADWKGSDWVWLGADQDGRDGWSWSFDTGSLPEQKGGAFYVWAFDWANNWTGAGVWNLGIDRTPPTVTAGVQQMYGDAPFRDFWVTWWDGWDNLSGVASYDVQYRDGAGGVWTDLAIGTTDVYTRFIGLDGHTYYFRARARDFAGNQSAYAGGDGDAQHTVEICDIAPDAYEADDAAASARRILPDAPLQVHNFHVEGDQDWVRFYAAAGITYTLATTSTSTHADTVIYLYDGSGTTLIAYNDDYPGMWPLSRLDWQPLTGGFYLIKVVHWDPWAYGCTTEYGLSITGSEPTFYQNYLPLVLRKR